jgi:hypothetical protein
MKGSIDRDKKLEYLYQLIHIFDGLSVLRKVHPDTIEDIVEVLKDKKIKRLWMESRKDAEKIIYHPLKIPGIPQMMKMAQYVKLVIPLSSIYIVLFIGYIFHPKMLPFPGIFGNPIYLILAFGIATLSTFTYIGIDFLIRRKIVRVEKEKAEYFWPYQRRFKELAQTLINIFLSEFMKRSKRNSDNKEFIFELNHPDYRGLNLIRVKGRHLFFFKKKYPTYLYEPPK